MFVEDSDIAYIALAEPGGIVARLLVGDDPSEYAEGAEALSLMEESGDPAPSVEAWAHRAGRHLPSQVVTDLLAKPWVFAEDAVEEFFGALDVPVSWDRL